MAIVDWILLYIRAKRGECLLIKVHTHCYPNRIKNNKMLIDFIQELNPKRTSLKVYGGSVSALSPNTNLFVCFCMFFSGVFSFWRVLISKVLQLYQQYQLKMALAIPSEQPLPISPSAFLLRKANTVPNICIHLDFAPNLQATCSPFMPSFNRDGRHFTPSFILAIDKSRYEDHSEVYLGMHLRKWQQMQQQKSILMVPKPSKNNSYCCVCKLSFEDYLTHVNTPSHLFLMRKSDYHTKIEELCQGFKNAQGKQSDSGKKMAKKRGRPAKTKGICKLPSLASKRSLSGKETDDSNRAEDIANQVVA